jgi:hypothetical protein
MELEKRLKKARNMTQNFNSMVFAVLGFRKILTWDWEASKIINFDNFWMYKNQKQICSRNSAILSRDVMFSWQTSWQRGACLQVLRLKRLEIFQKLKHFPAYLFSSQRHKLWGASYFSSTLPPLNLVGNGLFLARDKFPRETQNIHFIVYSPFASCGFWACFCSFLLGYVQSPV